MRLTIFQSFRQPVLEFFFRNPYCPSKSYNWKVFFPDQFIDFRSPQVESFCNLRNGSKHLKRCCLVIWFHCSFSF